MKAAVRTKAGPPEVLQVKEVPKPTPKDNEVLVRIHASTVTGGDALVRHAGTMMWLIMRLFMGEKKPKIIIPGQEFAGEVEAAGKDVKLFKKGDKVFGSTSLVGANAQYICMPEDGPLVDIPTNMTYMK